MKFEYAKVLSMIPEQVVCRFDSLLPLSLEVSKVFRFVSTKEKCYSSIVCTALVHDKVLRLHLSSCST